MRRRGTHVRVPIDTMPLATRAVLEVAEMNGVWDGNLPENAQIRIAVPEPRVDAEQIADPEALRKAIGRNYAIMVDGKVRHGSRALKETIMVDGKPFEYTVDAGGFWQMHREAPMVLPQYVIDQIRETPGDRAPRNGRNLVIWDLYSGWPVHAAPRHTARRPCQAREHRGGEGRRGQRAPEPEERGNPHRAGIVRRRAAHA